VKRRLAVAAVLLAVAAAACADDDEDASTSDTSAAGDSSSTTAAGGGEGEVLVAAASSLTDAFEAMEPTFESANEGVDIVFTFDSSSILAGQIVDEGAPVDVFASADGKNMQTVADARLIEDEPEIFAHNRLVIIVPPGNPDGVASIDDLADLDVVALCGEDVPCGKYAAEILGNAGVTIEVDHVTRGQNAKATVSAVADGDANAGIVYVTDLQAAGDTLDGVEIPDDINVIAAYPIGITTEADPADGAAAFVAYVTGPEGQATLQEFGFLEP
jgi:molybdate transport system substrate-binding protein